MTYAKVGVTHDAQEPGLRGGTTRQPRLGSGGEEDKVGLGGGEFLEVHCTQQCSYFWP